MSFQKLSINFYFSMVFQNEGVLLIDSRLKTWFKFSFFISFFFLIYHMINANNNHIPTGISILNKFPHLIVFFFFVAVYLLFDYEISTLYFDIY